MAMWRNIWPRRRLFFHCAERPATSASAAGLRETGAAGSRARQAVAISLLKSRLRRLRLAWRLPRRRSRAATLTSPIQRYCSTPNTPQSTKSPATNSQESAARRRFLPLLMSLLGQLDEDDAASHRSPCLHITLIGA